MFQMTPVPIQLFQQFRNLPLQEQLQLSAQINQYLVQYFEHLTRDLDQEERKNWQLLSKKSLNNAFSDDEPDYSSTNLSK
jgi:hypothetical protein